MLEGPAGAGKTELATSVSRAYGVPILRLQCYQGINEEKAIGQYDKSLQELFVLLMSKSDHTPDWAEIKREVTSRAYFMAGPLLEAIEQDQRCVLLIDEIDKVDYAFEAQAFKRACSCFGLGRYFYNFAEMWVEVDQYKQPKQLPRLPSWALPNAERQPAGEERRAPQTAGNPETAVQKGPLDADVTGKIEGCRRELGSALFGDILKRVANVRSARDIPNQKLQQIVLSSMESCGRAMTRIREIAAEIPETKFYAILDDVHVSSLDRIPNFDVLKALGNEMNRAASQKSIA
jgi:ATPase family associated with various cellular activities (AAA)